jgi:GTP-binding protein Era
MERYGREGDFLEIIPISALTGDNVPLLLGRIFAALPEGPPLYDPDFVTDRTERFLAAERIREKVVERTREEIPYCTAVLLRGFDESERASRRLVRIEADILVEKRSQAGIIVGHRGAVLREIGTSARRDIEALLGCRVYLHLEVKPAEKWRNDEAVLDALDLR